MYTILTDNNRNTRHLPKNSNLINYSLFKTLSCQVPFRGFSIKYVIEGCEQYTINGKIYRVEAGQYLLANNYAEGHVQIESTNMVRGVCIDLSLSILMEVFASFQRPDTAIADLSLEKFFSTPEFLENQYRASQTSTGQLLLETGAILSRNPFHAHHFSDEFYYNLAERLVSDNRPICQQFKTLDAVKLATRKELLRRVNTGKEFMDAHFSSPLEIVHIAKESGISEYHFYRLFKTIHGNTPYQYMLNKRLEFALIKLKSQNCSLTDIALDAGFSDIHTFSKSFKKKFGLAPSSYMKQIIAH